jgi:hypothetical protein
MKILRFLDFLPYTFPPALPILFNSAYNFSLLALLKYNIRGTQP